MTPPAITQPSTNQHPTFPNRPMRSPPCLLRIIRNPSSPGAFCNRIRDESDETSRSPRTIVANGKSLREIAIPTCQGHAPNCFGRNSGHIVVFHPFPKLKQAPGCYLHPTKVPLASSHPDLAPFAWVVIGIGNLGS